MGLTKLDKETLYLKCATLKDEFASWGKSRKVALTRPLGEIGTDILTVCNELIGLIDQFPELEKAVQGMKLIKELRNFASNL